MEQKTVPIYRELTARTDASASVELRARVEGILLEQLYEEGKPVKKGEILIKIDPLPFLANLNQPKRKCRRLKPIWHSPRSRSPFFRPRRRLAQARARLIREEKSLNAPQP
ncbi:biotin/lipoyl-binding protein [bacterium]|nr:biotin/lipoyl-binding protein [bacterium]